jgi:hypothetical protein
LPEARDPVAVAIAAAAQAMGIACTSDGERSLPENEPSSTAREYLQEANRECNESSVTIQRAREEIVSGALRVKYEIAAHSQFLIKAVRKRQVELMKSVDCIEEQQHTRLHYLQQLMHRSDNELDILFQALSRPGIDQSIDFNVGCRGAVKRSAELLSSGLSFLLPSCVRMLLCAR